MRGGLCVFLPFVATVVFHTAQAEQCCNWFICGTCKDDEAEKTGTGKYAFYYGYGEYYASYVADPGGSDGPSLKTSTTSPSATTTTTTTTTTATPPPASPKRNVLLIIVDDLRPELMSAYDQEYMITPSLDSFSSTATIFNRAYAQQAICGPSRNSFLSGRNPQRTQAWNLLDSFRGAGPDWFSLPGYFKKHGYTTLGSGKIFHTGLPPSNDGNLSWSEVEGLDFPVSSDDLEGACSSDYFNASERLDGRQSIVCPDNQRNLSTFIDFQSYVNFKDKFDYAAAQHVEHGTPFFLAFGIHKPHLPFRFPTSYGNYDNVWDMYGATEDIPLPEYEDFPDDMPGVAITFGIDGSGKACVWNECYAIPGGSLGCEGCAKKFPDNTTRTLRKAYYASVTWADFLIGKVLSLLDNENDNDPTLRDQTVVAIVGDHGFQLGEQNVWAKSTNFELSTRVPMMIREPGQSVRQEVDLFVELVDLYPTLASLANLPAPPDVDGTDLSSIMGVDASETTVKEVNAAFSEFPRCVMPDEAWTDISACVDTPRNNFYIMGYSVRTEEWRCTLWMWWSQPTLDVDFDKGPILIELYMHIGDTGTDFDAYETENVSAEAGHGEDIATCKELAAAHWGSNRTATTTSSQPRPY